MAAGEVDLGAFVDESARDRASDGTSGAEGLRAEKIFPEAMNFGRGARLSR